MHANDKQKTVTVTNKLDVSFVGWALAHADRFKRKETLYMIA